MTTCIVWGKNKKSSPNLQFFFFFDRLFVNVVRAEAEYTNTHTHL